MNDDLDNNLSDNIDRKDTLEILSEQRNELRNLLYGYYTIGKYEVKNLCLDTNPCQHHVLDTNTGKCFLLNRTQIYMLCIWYWVDIPHFYPDWRRAWTH